MSLAQTGLAAHLRDTHRVVRCLCAWDSWTLSSTNGAQSFLPCVPTLTMKVPLCGTRSVSTTLVSMFLRGFILLAVLLRLSL